MDSPLDLDAFKGDVNALAEQADAFLGHHAYYARAREVWNSLADADRHEIALSIARWLLQ
jgi:hypothetical protein